MEIATVLTRSFEGYLLGSVNVDVEAYERRFRSEDLDPLASHVYFCSGLPIGISLICRRGWTSRVAGMGIVSEQRGRGLGKKILRDAIDKTILRGDRKIVLEVFEQNTPAVNLYKNLEFVVQRRLFGYHREPGATTDTPDKLVEADPLEVARVVATEGHEELPWMLSAETLSSSVPPAKAYHLHHRAYALVDDLNAETLSLSAVVVRQADRREGWGTRLLLALENEVPGRSWYIPAIVPEGPSSVFLGKCGWRKEDLNQLEMSLDLTSNHKASVTGS